MTKAAEQSNRVAAAPAMDEIRHNDQLRVSEVLEWCVDGCPGGALPHIVAAAHRIAWARFQATDDAEWRNVAENCVRTMSLARMATAAEAAAVLEFYREIPVAAWPKCRGWSRRQLRSEYLACAKRDHSYLEGLKV